MNDFLEKEVEHTKEEDFENISVVGKESNTLFTAVEKKTKEEVFLFKSPQLSEEYALQFIYFYSHIQCDHILPIYKYYFHPCVTFVTKIPKSGKPLPDILNQITEKNKLTIILQIIDTIRIFQSYHIFSSYFEIENIYVNSENDYHIQFCSLFPIYITQRSFSNYKMNTALLFNSVSKILGPQKAPLYFDESNLYQSASKILYNIIQKIKSDRNSIGINISRYETHFQNLIELANKKTPERSNSNGQENILEAQYLCAISGINDRKYIENLAFQNHPEGQFLYGYRMFNGIGLRKDKVHGAKHIKNAANCSCSEAQLYYSLLLKEGNGVRENMNRSMNYLKFAADNKNKEALVLYGHSISNTIPMIAIQCYKEAAERGSIEGLFYYLFSAHKNKRLKSGNKNDTCSSILNFNVTFCANIPIYKGIYKELLNSLNLGYLILMSNDKLNESYSQFLIGFFYKQIKSIFSNPNLIEKFDINDIYEFKNSNDFEEKEDFYLEKSMKNGNQYATYIMAKKLLKKGQIQIIFDYLKNLKDCEYKNIKYYYAKCIQDMPGQHVDLDELISEAAKGECFEAIFEEGENLIESESNFDWSKIYQAAKSGISEACLKYGKYIIKSNVNKGKYFLKLCASEMPEAEYVLSSYSDNFEGQMKHLKRAADNGFIKAAHLYGFRKYNEGDYETAIEYFKKEVNSKQSILPSSFLYLAHCLYIMNNRRLQLQKNMLKSKLLTSQEQNNNELTLLESEIQNHNELASLTSQQKSFHSSSLSLINECCYYIKSAAEFLHSQVLLSLGICLFYGIGMNKNESECYKMFNMASSVFDYLGIYNLAVCMENGIGKNKTNQLDVYSYLINQKNNADKRKNISNSDEDESGSIHGLNRPFSTVLFKSNSEIGLSYIYLYLGYLQHCKGDLKEAKRYFKNAASKGNMTAAVLYARCVETTSNSLSKLNKALKIYNLVARHLSAPEFTFFECATELRRKAELCEELLKKKLEAEFWNLAKIKKIADEGDNQAQFLYGVYCMQSAKSHAKCSNESVTNGTENETKSCAFNCCVLRDESFGNERENSFELENGDNRNEMSSQSRREDGVDDKSDAGTNDTKSDTSSIIYPSKEEGIRYIECSAAAGNDKAEEYLARCLIKGEGIKRDGARAVSLLVSASNKGNAQAKNNLGFLYKRGMFVCQNDKMAFELFKESADLGNPKGLLHYAMCLMKGRGVEMNTVMAMPALRKAREMGVPRASYILGLHYLNCDPNGETEGIKLIKEAANFGYKKARFILDL